MEKEAESHALCFVVYIEPEKTHQVIELWKHYTFPPEVKVISRYLLIGRHMSVAIFDAPSEEAVLKITAPFSNLGIAHIAPAMPLETAIRVNW